MAKISVKSKYSGSLEAEHDSWKEWIIEWVPDEVDLLMERYDPDKGNANIAASQGHTRDTNSENYEVSISAPPAPRADRPTPALTRIADRSTSAPTVVRTPITTFRRPAPTPVDPFAARRAAARESFQRQVAASRSHVSDVLSKLGNAKEKNAEQ
jgi:hypothetical protein